MSRGPNMSYCMCENTAGALRQVIEAMREAGSIEEFTADMTRDERLGFKEMYDLCLEFVEIVDDES